MTAPLLSLAAVLTLVLAAVLGGGRVLSLLRADARGGERVLYALVLGVGLQGTLLLLLSALGWMHPLLLWSAVLVPAVLGHAEIGTFRACVANLRAAAATLSTVERVLVLLVAGVVLGILLIGALSPLLDWDSLMYHVRLPAQFLAAGRLYLPPDGTHLAFLGLFQFLYLPLLAVGAESGPALLNAAFTVALAGAVVVTGARLFTPRTGLLAAVALWGSSSMLLVGVTPRIDVALVFVLLVAQLAALRSLDDDAPWAGVVVAAVAGVAIAMKYHALPFLAFVAPVAAWGIVRRAGSHAVAGRQLAVAAAITLAIATPWLMKNVVYFGAPLYPFFSARQLPPFLAALAGSSALPANLPEGALAALGQSREGISLMALLLRPAQLTVELEGVDFTRNPIFLAAPLALLFLRDRRILWLALPAAGYLAVALGYFAHTNLRYLMPAVPAFLLVTVEALRRVIERQRRMDVALLLLALAVAVPGLQRAASRLVTPVRTQVALGMLPPAALLNRDLAYVGAQVAEERSDSTARILMLYDARGYYYRREVLQDNVLQHWPLLVTMGYTDRCLEGTGITHVLLNRGAVDYYIRRGMDPARVLWDRFPEFERRCLEPLAVAPGAGFYRVRRAP